MDVRVFPPLGHSKPCCIAHGTANISSRSCFQLFWVNTLLWHCWHTCWCYCGGLRSLHSLLHSGCTILHSHQSAQEFQCLYILANTCLLGCVQFCKTASLTGGRISHCALHLYFPDAGDAKHFPHASADCWCWCVFFGKK